MSGLQYVSLTHQTVLIPVGSYGRDSQAEHSGSEFLLDVGQLKMEKIINPIIGN